MLLSVSTDAERVYSMYRLSVNQYHYLICVTFVCTRGAWRTSRVRLTLGARGVRCETMALALFRGFDLPGVDQRGRGTMWKSDSFALSLVILARNYDV